MIGYDKSKLPVDYYWNKSAWMQSSIWNEYLKLLNKRMEKLNKKILLLINNAPVHTIENSSLLINIRVYYLLLNTTAHLQFADVRIINSFKVCIY